MAGQHEENLPKFILVDVWSKTAAQGIDQESLNTSI
jgi:hypothetical protein